MGINKFLSNGLILDSYDLFIDWTISEKTFLETAKAAVFEKIIQEDFGYSGYRVESKFLKSEKKYIITFNFVKNKFTSVNIFDNEIFVNPIDKYYLMQDFLEEQIGSPSRTRNTKKEKVCVWKMNKITITHMLLDRFGLQEILEIKIK